MKNFLTNVIGADLRSLAALRIGCALLIITDLVQRSSDLVAHYTDFGVVPRTLVMQHSSSRWYVSLHFMSGVWEVQALLFICAALAAGALLVGYRTLLASILSWAFFMSLCTRNPYIVQGGDMLLRLVLFWGMFLPWGSVYSVDRAWRNESSEPSPLHSSWATAAYAIQIVSMYWFTAVLKSSAQWWSEGSAVYYALSIDYIVTPFGKVLLGLPYNLLMFTTWTVVIFEIIGPLLLLAPVKKGWVRLVTTLSFMALQLAFLLCFLIGIFPLIGIVCMFFFLPSLFWDRLSQRLEISPRTLVKIYYDSDCGFCLHTVRFIQTFFLPRIEIAGAQATPEIAADMRRRNSWVVLDTRGERHFGYNAVLVVAGASPILRVFLPILKVPVVRWLGDRLYQFVAAHRPVSCHLVTTPSVRAPSSAKLRRMVSLGLAATIVYVFALNLTTVPAIGLKIPENIRSLSNIFGLDQTWNMFAPFPSKDDGWYVIPGKLNNGKTVDLFRGGKPVDFTKPAYVSLEFKNHRWRKYMDLLRKRDALPAIYAQYVCREWNHRHDSGEKLEALEIIYLLEWTQPGSDYSPVQKQSVGIFNCSR